MRTMEKLLQIADQAASNSVSSSEESMSVCPDKFSNFMKQNPIWNFYEISQSDYVSMPDGEKMKLINDYYNHMSNGKRKFDYLFFCLEFQLQLLDLAK